MKVVLSPWIALLAATILVIGTNAGIIGSSRLAYSMSLHKQLPPILGRVHRTRFTPYVSIALFGTVAALLITPGSISFLADLYAFGAMISFTVAHVCVVALRFKMPDFERPWRTPINIPFRGKSIPVLAVIGASAPVTVWVVVVLTHAEGRAVGFAWMGVGHRGLRPVPARQGVLAHEDRRGGAAARLGPGGHRLRPDPRADRRIAHQRRDDGARLPARHREEVGRRRPLRDRGAAQPAARRAPHRRAREGRQGAGDGGPRGRRVQGPVHAARGHGAPGGTGDRRGGRRCGAPR